VGLLAGVFGDGIVRVMDVREQWLGTAKKAVNIAVTAVGWEYSFGERCLATCVCWKSHTEIVVGCSNGGPMGTQFTDVRICRDFRSFR
jgi:hypothetical protein